MEAKSAEEIVISSRGLAGPWLFQSHFLCFLEGIYIGIIAGPETTFT